MYLVICIYNLYLVIVTNFICNEWFFELCATQTLYLIQIKPLEWSSWTFFHEKPHFLAGDCVHLATEKCLSADWTGNSLYQCISSIRLVLLKSCVRKMEDMCIKNRQNRFFWLKFIIIFQFRWVNSRGFLWIVNNNFQYIFSWIFSKSFSRYLHQNTISIFEHQSTSSSYKYLFMPCILNMMNTNGRSHSTIKRSRETKTKTNVIHSWSHVELYFFR